MTYVWGLVRILASMVIGALLGISTMSVLALLIVGPEGLGNALVIGGLLGATAGVLGYSMLYSAILAGFGGGYARRAGDAYYRYISGEESRDEWPKE